ncbi:MAG: hypothetical protein HY815_33025 [Candidatus Riflebacteria bacterium]|nr:hypothetical protein [Candidatus Riflebacteria bacterium]
MQTRLPIGSAITLLCLLLVATAHPALAQISILEVEQNGTGGAAAGGQAAAGTGATTEVATESDFDKVVQKLKKNELLTEKEFVIYLRGLEAANTSKSWAHLITKLHHDQYSADSNLRLCGIRLFLNGKENEGWESVNLLNVPVPKFIKNDKGERVDIAHSYAGVRALVERGSVRGILMGNVNTGWGDSVQVVGGEITGSWTIVKGIFTLNTDRIKNGAREFGNAPNFKPPGRVSRAPGRGPQHRQARSHPICRGALMVP